MKAWKKLCGVMIVLVVSVLLTSCGAIRPEKMIEEYPYLLGEWSSEYFAEDPLVTLNEDGTCVYRGIAGTWKGDKESTANRPEINIKLENKEKYSLRWGPGYYGSMDDPIGYWIGVYQNDELIFDKTSNLYQTSDKRIDVLSAFPWLVGRWSTTPNGEATLILRENGTCSFLGEETVWGLSIADTMPSGEDWVPIKIQYSGVDDHIVLMITRKQNEETAYYENFHYISCSYPGNGQFFQNRMGGYEWYNLDAVTAVEITPENILDYFEPYERVDWYTDEFGTVTDARIASYLKLKDEYAPQVVGAYSKIAVEFELHNTKCKLQMTANESTYTKITLADAETVAETRESMIHQFYEPGIKEEWEYVYAIGIDSETHFLDEANCKHTMAEEWEILRVAGTLYLYDPK